MGNNKETFLQRRLEQYLKEEGIDPNKTFGCLNPACTHSKNSMKYIKTGRVTCKECGISWDIFDIFEARYGDGWEAKLYNRYGLPSERGIDSHDDYSVFIEYAFQNARASNEYRRAAYQLGRSGLRGGEPIAGYVDAFFFDDGQEGPAFIVKTEPDGEGFCAIRCSDETCHAQGNVSLPYFSGPSDKTTYIATDTLSAWYIGEMIRTYLIVADDLDYLKKKVKDSTCKEYCLIHTSSCDPNVVDGIRTIVRDGGRSFKTWALDLPQSDFYHAFKAAPMHAFTELTKLSKSTELTKNITDPGTSARSRTRETLIENMENPQQYAISTGFPKLDACLGGGLKSGIYVLAGMPGVGKTTFLLQLCDQITALGHQTLYFSFEMRAINLIAKSISRSALASYQMTHGWPAKSNEVPSVNDVMRYLSNPQQADDSFVRAMLIYREMYVKSVKFYDLNGRRKMEDEEMHPYTDVDTLIGCVESHEDSKPVVFIDYLQMLKIIPKSKAEGTQNTERQVIDEVLDRFRELSERLDIIIVLISTLSRSLKGYGGPVKMELLKESGGIEYKADVILGLNYASGIKENSKKEGPYGAYYEETLNILKNRGGEDFGKLTYNYYGAYGYFEEIDASE